MRIASSACRAVHPSMEVEQRAIWHGWWCLWLLQICFRSYCSLTSGLYLKQPPPPAAAAAMHLLLLVPCFCVSVPVSVCVRESIVFMIGGGNYLERETLAAWATRSTPPRQVWVCVLGGGGGEGGGLYQHIHTRASTQIDRGLGYRAVVATCWPRGPWQRMR